MSKGPGHLFVVQGDLSQINVDVALVPCDAELNVTRGFAPLLQRTVPGPADWVRPEGIAPPVDTGPERLPVWLDEPGVPRVCLVNITLPDGERPNGGRIDWLVRGLESAVRSAASEQPTRTRRERALIGLPLVGVGLGGFTDARTSVLERVLGLLDLLCQEDGSPDIVLVLRRRSDYAAVQGLRPSHYARPAEVERLAGLIRADRVVPFLGAGLSMAAGLPGWGDLLHRVAREAGISDEDYTALKALPPEDRAEAIERRLREQGMDLHPTIEAAVSVPRVSLAHSELASMRFDEAITTNYDTLYERACEAVLDGPQVTVIPGKAPESGGPWIVKMHGDIRLPASLVLTRGQYLAFDSQAVPLASLVQAHMITHHLLFLGYSLRDGNFIRFVQQVSQMFEAHGGAGTQIGTVLTLGDRPELEMLWGSGFTFVPMNSSETLPGQARELEIFLDNVAQAACDDAPYFLDPRYEPLLSEPEKKLAELLGGVARAIEAVPPTSPAVRTVNKMLQELGWRED